MVVTPEAMVEPSRPAGLSRGVRQVWRLVGPFAGLLAIALLFASLTGEPKLFAGEGVPSWLGWIATPRGMLNSQFMTAYNWRLIVVQAVVVGVAALGMTMVMIAGGIDLSVGSVVALVTVAIGLLVRDHHMATALAMLLGIGVGGLCGLANGGLITGLGVVPFIITLGSLKVFRGLAKWLSDSTQVYVPRELKPGWLGSVLNPEPTPYLPAWTHLPGWLNLAPGVWALLILGILVALTLRYSVLGRYLYAVGSNEATARLCGVNVPAVKLAVYALAGLTFGLAGALQFAYLNAEGDPVTAEGLELQVIAAVVIGGGSLSGGEGTVVGTLVGCLIMSVLNNGCVQAGISNASQDIIIGAIIVAAVTIDRLRRRGA